MLDIHAHLYWESYDADRDDVVRRAFDAGIEKMICVGTEPGDNPRAVEVAERYENVYASVGLHPHFFNEVEKNTNFKTQKPNKAQNTNHKFQKEIQELREVAKHPKVVAIGECGLDYYRRQSTDNSQQETITEEMKAIQKEGFLAQMEIARELGVPLIIHTRPSAGTVDAYEDVFELLKAKSYQLKAILHCYQGDTEITKKFLELPNVYFSFAGSITYPVKKVLVGTGDDSSEVVKLVPLDRLFVETDAPFLAPVPHRGERNEPAYAIATAEKVCELKGCSREELDQALRESFQYVFDK
jgi:TatD DNase family protein